MALVEQSYENLEKRITSVETKLDTLGTSMHEGQKAMIRTLYTTFTVFATLIITAFGVIITLVT